MRLRCRRNIRHCRDEEIHFLRSLPYEPINRESSRLDQTIGLHAAVAGAEVDACILWRGPAPLSQQRRRVRLSLFLPVVALRLGSPRGTVAMPRRVLSSYM